MKNVYNCLRFSLACMLCMVPPLFARQDPLSDSNGMDQKQRVASAIFNEIMLTLPGDMKAKVDSASMSGKCARTQPSSKGSAAAESCSSTRNAAEKRNSAVANLPEDVRNQVEKAITDIDLMNKDRQIQFKEYEKKHPGSR
jgi:hypothetical protein